MTATLLGRHDLIAGLRELVLRLHLTGDAASVRIVGGAALLLRYFDRSTTLDIDASIQPAEKVFAVAHEIARDFGWQDDWLNDGSKIFIPTIGKTPEWEAIYDDKLVSIWVLSAEALLAM